MRDIAAAKRLKKRIADLKAAAQRQAAAQDELAAIKALQELVEIDPERKAEYLKRIEALYVAYDRRASEAAVVRFHQHLR